MITVDSFPGSPPPGWDDTVCRLGGSVFHTAIWGEYQRTAIGTQPVYLLGRNSHGETRAAALALLSQSRRPVASRIFRDLALYAHPCARDGDAAAVTKLLEHTEEMARQLGCRQLRLDSMMSGDSPFLPSEHGYTETQRVEFTVDLTRAADDLWRGIRKDQRERIRRLDRDGVCVEVARTRDEFEALREARESTQAKVVQRGQEYDLPADPAFYDRLFEHLVRPGAGRLFVAKKQGTILAALFFTTFNGRACSMFSGSTDVGYKLGAQSRLFWAAVETFKAEGYHELNRGGVPASAEHESDPLHGIYLFKLRLGTTPQVCRCGVKILSPLRDRLYRLRQRLGGLGG